MSSSPSSSSTATATATLAKMTLADLPLEVVTHILLFLPIPSVLRCKAVNRYLRDLISNSVEVQYYIHRSISAQLDNPRCELSIVERLHQLLLREGNWQEFNFNFDKTIDIPFPTSGIYDLTGGIYLLGDASRKVLHYAQLPSERDQGAEWKDVCLEEMIIDMGFCVYEHDLLAVITTHLQDPEQSEQNHYPSHEIRLYLFQVSTGKPHPEAQQPVISVMNTRWEKPAVGIEIVGDNLVLILSYYEHAHKPDDLVFVYEWRTGKLKMKIGAPYHSYAGLLFLTEDIFLLPNTNAGTLEYWRIPRTPSEATPLRPFFALSLPRLSTDRTFGHISCRAEPNPVTSFRHTAKPFHANPHHAIAIFNVNIRSDNRQLLPAFLQHLHPSSSFVFFVHRSSLVNCLDRLSNFISDDEEPLPVPYSLWGPSICRWFAAEAFPTRWITTTAGQRCIIIPDVGTETDRAPLILLNFNQMDVARILAAEKEDLEATIREEAMRRMKREKQRMSKGVSIGQGMDQQARYERPKGEESNTDYAEEHGEESSELGEDEKLEALSDSTSSDLEEFERTPPSKSRRRAKAITRVGDALDDSQRCFEDIVYSSLPYTVCSSLDKYTFEGVLLDEERILGLRTNIIGRITAVHVFHLG